MATKLRQYDGKVPARPLSPRRRRDTVAVLLFDKGALFESSIPITVFGAQRTELRTPAYRVLVCAGEEGALTTSAGIGLSTPYGLEGLDRAGTIVVPTWRSVAETPPEPALQALRRAHREGARIVSLCTGAFVLAAAGLLDNRPATTHWMYAQALAKRYPSVRVDARALYVDDGDILTAGGSAAGIDLCLHIIRLDHGSEAANQVARRLVVPPHRTGGQAPYIDHPLPKSPDGDPLAEVMAWALEHLDEGIDIDTLARRAYMSRRTFDRRFRALTGSAPLQWLLTQRVLHAQRLLETTDLPVDQIARQCGFSSSVSLRPHFRRLLGTSPAAYRESFHVRGIPRQRNNGSARAIG